MQLLEGYAFLLSGVIELYEATLEPGHLDFAIELADAMIARFYDAENGGFWQSAAGATDLILRVKDDYDGAEPSGNSVATLALLKLGAITGRKEFTEAAGKTLRLFAPPAATISAGDAVHAARAGFFAARTPARGHCRARGFRGISRTARRRAFGLSAEQNYFGQHRRGRGICADAAGEETAVVYLCTGKSCQPPTSDAGEIRKMLE